MHCVCAMICAVFVRAASARPSECGLPCPLPNSDRHSTSTSKITLAKKSHFRVRTVNEQSGARADPGSVFPRLTGLNPCLHARFPSASAEQGLGDRAPHTLDLFCSLPSCRKCVQHPTLKPKGYRNLNPNPNLQTPQTCMAPCNTVHTGWAEAEGK